MSASSHNRNPGGKNQHGEKVGKEDPVLVAALQGYHEELMTNNGDIAKRLEKEHGIRLSGKSIQRARKHNGLLGGAANLKSKSQQDAEQLVLAQLDLDPSNQAGPRTIRHRLASRQGEHLPRAFIASTMKVHAPEGFEMRNPGSRKIIRVKKIPIGIHDRWSCDGHDKLYKIGFPVYGFVEDGVGFWLDAWVVPSNRFAIVIGYLFLCVVEKYGGIPIQLTTDCGSETTLAFGLQNALREIFHPDFDGRELPAHVYLRSVHNISVERAWLRLRLDWGDNAVLVYEKGEEEGWYNPHDENQQMLCRWLWAKLLRKTLAQFVRERNSYKSRKDNSKAGPSGMSRNNAFFMPESWGGKNCLLPVDLEVVREIKKELGGDEILEFVSREFSDRAEAAYQTLGVQDLTFDNVWPIFKELLPLMFP